MSRKGFSIIELVTVLGIFLALSYFALPAFDVVQVKSREKLLQQRLFDLRRGIDFYVNARNSTAVSGVPYTPYPLSIASLTEAIPGVYLKNGADTGPFVPAGSIGNPFGRSEDEFTWDIRDCDGVWHKNQLHHAINYAAGVYDVRFPEDGVHGWNKAIDETFYKDW
ncbi:MAG: hypothetical protein CVV41_17065 [Candidatus Riflebacteria bacterium HGW-Riflebacteria-1]|nr:MAG: hypothetical protein CVV41_17065 [Candidatus Riflebacteria bacterium HGW-Riflebacteria-1]